MLIGIPKEKSSNEARVSITPKVVKQLIKIGFDIFIEHEAGKNSGFDNQSYFNEGAKIVNSQDIWQVDIILKINPPNDEEISLIKQGSILISFIWPAQNQSLVKKLAKQKITVIAMDAVPRISRAQSLDALSSMANIAGYRSIIEAAYEFGGFFGGQITAAGKISPAKILVIGAGVAGLAAISVAVKMGAIVRVFDTRLEVKEQIKSLGAEFLELDFGEKSSSSDGYSSVMSEAFIKAEMKLFYNQTREVDIIITTAMVPGKPAPKLITKEMVLNNMKKGSVIVDIAAQAGGNCSLTVCDQVLTTTNGVKIIGYTNLPSRLPSQSSQLYSTNIFNLIKLIYEEEKGKVKLDLNDVIIRNITIVDNGKIIWPAPPVKISITEKTKPISLQEKQIVKNQSNFIYKYCLIILLLISFVYLANNASTEFLSHFNIFILSCIIGYYIVWNVNHALHTPLMSVTNAISGIIIIGAILQMDSTYLINYISFIAILVSSINIFGGFNITHRMLKMFRKG
ncbi:NAD(P)(+) transhydrogenase (Re/Si-specific) subunit alpha [Candidatus Pantoea edessiphila]|uniref:NAD(P) transhydrogenase subunit alpha n=1 Tax=Candidatus Pantoea edessiphila TaxID=2044610 RepID=A0A2P5T2L6_9GAMM|nr:Re/Si-specific NAD(P)(+) transhydrogenase subunit alpha [Candidatus Pantoea edessiphila]PPI88818.1 NAD(P)(+) transhydrogenase (Re/Si-specific) subunit alpha [Candidatus Pantoea edessiphila]